MARNYNKIMLKKESKGSSFLGLSFRGFSFRYNPILSTFHKINQAAGGINKWIEINLTNGQETGLKSKWKWTRHWIEIKRTHSEVES